MLKDREIGTDRVSESGHVRRMSSRTKPTTLLLASSQVRLREPMRREAGWLCPQVRVSVSCGPHHEVQSSDPLEEAIAKIKTIEWTASRDTVMLAGTNSKKNASRDDRRYVVSHGVAAARRLKSRNCSRPLRNHSRFNSRRHTKASFSSEKVTRAGWRGT